MVEFAVIVVFMLAVAAVTEPVGRRHGAATRWVRAARLRLNHFRPQDPRRSEEPVAGEVAFTMSTRGAPHH
ncbi:hypothetical protein [Rhodococcus phenolicus]|uniref:hypothetical protein n=1 Tax=Rhodococcus phenolicus TaxID=263849 RepID=UPI00082964CA|nr:hypothetical protein [Rhodococcus phenolicus]